MATVLLKNPAGRSRDDYDKMELLSIDRKPQFLVANLYDEKTDTFTHRKFIGYTEDEIKALYRKNPCFSDSNGWTYTSGTKKRRSKTLSNKPRTKRSKIYVGVKGTKYIPFRSVYTPTRKSHGDRFTYVIGPFRTLAGAQYMAMYGRGNPHLQTVDDAERLAKKELTKKNPLVGPYTAHLVKFRSKWEAHYGGRVTRHEDKKLALKQIQGIARRQKHHLKIVDLNTSRQRDFRVYFVDEFGNVIK